MNFQSIRRKPAGALRVPSSRNSGNMGLETEMDSGSGDDEDGLRGTDGEEQVMGHGKAAAQPTRRLELRQPQATVETVVASVLNVIVENTDGQTVAQATFSTLPTAATVLSLPVGPVSLPSLEFQSGTVGLSLPPFPISTTASSPYITSAPVPTSLNSGNSTSTTLGRASSNSFRPLNGTRTSGVAKSSTNLFGPLITSSHSPTTLQTSKSNSILSSESSEGIFVTPTSASGSGSPITATTSSSSTNGAAAAASTKPNTPAIAGGVVGGVTGIAILFVLILLILRWRRRKLQSAPRELASSAEDDTRPGTSRSDAAMTQNPMQPWGAAAFMRSIKRQSAQTSTSGGAPSERGFQKISGRKIEPALLTGGDGYGNPRPGATATGSGSADAAAAVGFGAVAAGTAGAHFSTSSSNYESRDSQGASMLVGSGSGQRSSNPTESNRDTSGQTPTVPERKNPGFLRGSTTFSDSQSPSPPPESSSPPDVVVMRPGPARMPVHSVGFGAPSGRATPPPQHRLRTDAIGRSHPSMDGSRGSRGSKFAEGL